MLIYDGISQKYGHITCEVDFWHKPSTLILTIQGDLNDPPKMVHRSTEQGSILMMP